MRVTSHPRAVALALVAGGWRPVTVAGRTVDARSTQAVASRLGAAAVDVADAGRGDDGFADRGRRRRSLRRRPKRPAVDLVVIATPDSAIAGAAAAVAPSLRPGALVVHLSGASTLHELDAVLVARPDVEVARCTRCSRSPQVMPDANVWPAPGARSTDRRQSSASLSR